MVVDWMRERKYALVEKGSMAAWQWTEQHGMPSEPRHWGLCKHPEVTSLLDGLLRKRIVPGNGVRSGLK